MTKSFSFETLDVYRLLVEVNTWMHAAPWPKGSAWLRDQGFRALGGAVLTTAEGLQRKGKAGANLLDTAYASVGETVAVLEISGLPGAAEQQDKLRRVGAMLYKLIQLRQ